jgi:hypothetical protein
MKPSRIQNTARATRAEQTGIALLAMLTLLALWGMYLFVGQLNATQYLATKAHGGASALAEAKQALIGDAISTSSVSAAGYLHLPDLGQNPTGIPTEGNAASAFTGNDKNLSVLGKFPWKTVATSPLRDRHKECLWYVVSGRFKIIPKTETLNWDTQGQIDVIDSNGNFIASNLAALLVSTGPVLDGQSHALTSAAYSQCGGNYDARNYLDTFDTSHSASGEVNYFAGSTNNRVAQNSDNKRFVMANSDHYNDRFMYITVDDIFTPIIRRKDFAAAVSNLLDNPTFRSHLQSITLSGDKGTDTLKCDKAPDEAFCKNWKEMLFLTQLAMPTPITIDGISSSTNCIRVLVFSGRRGFGQSRITVADKSNKDNYLENTNATSFSVPTANSESFSGASNFDWRTPETDLVRCLP